MGIGKMILVLRVKKKSKIEHLRKKEYLRLIQSDPLQGKLMDRIVKLS